MIDRSPRQQVEDILLAIRKVKRYTAGLSADALAQNEMASDAVLRNFEVIGEAARNLPDELKSAHPEIPWRRMVGLRNVIIHEYFGVDMLIVWELAVHAVPELEPQLAALLAELPSD